METLEQIRQIRLEKIETLRSKGVEPYPYLYNRTHFSEDILANSEKLESSGELISAAGRLMSIRGHGKAAFGHLHDSKGKIQIYIRSDHISGQQFEIFQLLDIGDQIGVKGTVFKTRTGEITILVNELVLLSKAIRPLPIVKEKTTDEGTHFFDQFQDKEQRYRRRYLDLVVNPDVRKTFIMRNRILSVMRKYLDERGFLEVETPVLQSIYGGAFARPFTTHLNALDMDLYLRISDELYLKRLIVGGYDGVYEFCKDFRNEGMDRFHNPEFSLMELYVAYQDYNYMMELVEDMVSKIALEVTGSMNIQFLGEEINLTPPWKRLSFFDGIEHFSGKNIQAMNEPELRTVAKELEIEPEKFWGRGKLFEAIFDRVVEPNLVQPTFITDYPIEISPLAKRHRSVPGLVERFEPIVARKEIGNAFSELNDPLDQLQRFLQQKEFREKGDMEAQMMDEDYINALEYGMPPTAGLGIGIDRLVMLLTNSESIRDVILFPFMRPQSGEEKLPEEEKT